MGIQIVFTQNADSIEITDQVGGTGLTDALLWQIGDIIAAAQAPSYGGDYAVASVTRRELASTPVDRPAAVPE